MASQESFDTKAVHAGQPEPRVQGAVATLLAIMDRLARLRATKRAR